MLSPSAISAATISKLWWTTARRARAGGRIYASGESAMDIGAALRDAREQRAMSLDDVAQVTKIRVATLSAIESNQRDGLPEAFYLRSFVRAFARAVGMDPDDTVRKYFEQLEPAAPIENTATSPVEQLKQVALARDAIARDDRPSVGGQWLVIVILLVASLMGYRVIQSRARLPHPVSSPPTLTSRPLEIGTTGSLPHPVSPTLTDRPLEPPEAGTAESRQPVTAPAAESITAPAAESITAPAAESIAAPPAESAALHLELRFDGSCWLSVTADGTRVVSRMMEAGEQYVLDVRKGAVLRVGDPAALTFSINGLAGRSLGPAGEAVTAQITSDNYREFLRP